MANTVPFNVRTLGSNDVETMTAMLGMFAEAFDDAATYCGSRPRPEYLERLLASETFVAVAALVGDDVVGGLAAYELRKFEQERSELYIYDLAVAEDFRRMGIASALIEEVKRIARERGAWVVYVQADLGDDAAIALYTKHGIRENVLHFDISPQ